MVTSCSYFSSSVVHQLINCSVPHSHTFSTAIHLAPATVLQWTCSAPQPVKMDTKRVLLILA